MHTLYKTIVIPTMLKILNIYSYLLLSDNKITRFLSNIRPNIL